MVFLEFGCSISPGKIFSAFIGHDKIIAHAINFFGKIKECFQVPERRLFTVSN